MLYKLIIHYTKVNGVDYWTSMPPWLPDSCTYVSVEVHVVVATHCVTRRELAITDKIRDATTDMLDSIGMQII